MRYCIYFILLNSVLIIGCRHRHSELAADKVKNPIEKLTLQIKSNPKDGNLYNERAKLFIDAKQIDSAFRDINKAIELNPKKGDFYCTLSDIYFAKGKIMDCSKTLDKVFSIEPKNTNALLKIAELNLYFKKYDKTFEFIKKALDVDRINPKAYFMRGMALKEYGDTARAVADMHTATEQDPKFYDAYVQLGLLYSVKHDRLAIDCFNNAINIEPDNIEARYAKAMFCQENGLYNDAIQSYDNIIRINPNYKYVYYNLGFIHLVYLKVYKVAIDYFTKAIKCDPNYHEAFYNRGYSYELSGDMNNARQDYKKALELKTNYQKAIDGLNRTNN